MPQTTLGKWSVGLFIAFCLFFLAFIILVATGQRGDDALFSNLALTIPGLLAGVSVLSAMITGIINIVKSKERSFFVFLATAIGIMVLIFLIGEFSFPH
jgi:ABC-type Na+ efflux pump permease subunit